MFQEMEESELPMDVKMISVCLCAKEHVCINRMYVVCTSVAPGSVWNLHPHIDALS